MKAFTGKKLLIVLLCASGVFSVLIFRFLLPALMEDPLEILAPETPVRFWNDPSGRVVWIRRTCEGQYREDITLKQVPPELIRMILAAEDWNFFHHGGVDFFAVLRAAKQNLFSGRVISGASTITMQLANMTEHGKRGSLLRKIRQILKAWKLESLYSKERILTEYLNRLPFGGKFYGIEAASKYYFGRSVPQLTPGEGALLCGIPQRPNGYRLDRPSGKLCAMDRRKRILQCALDHWIISSSQKEKMEKEIPRLRDFQFPSQYHLAESDRRFAMHHALSLRESRNSFRVKTAFDENLSQTLLRILQRHVAELDQVRDAAAVLIENASGRIPVLIGTLDMESPQNGQVNGACAIRTAGSTLKPFLYAEALYGGVITEDTLLRDTPLRFGDYLPENYDGTFRGNVSAAEALSESLNAPAVRLAANLGTEHVEETFQRFHLRTDRKNGLSLVLGTAGYSLLELSGAYCFLLRGHGPEPSFLASGGTVRRRFVYPPSVRIMLSRMLRKKMLPGCGFPVVWKTGTSNGNRDAWCFAFTPEYTLGVWIGNKDGKASSAIWGTQSAAPVCGEIMTSLYPGTKRPFWNGDLSELEIIRICTETGMRAGLSCKETQDGFALKGIPAPLCRKCSGELGPDNLTILSPVPQNYQMEEQTLSITFRLAGNTPAHWYLDNRYLGFFPEKRVTVSPGKHKVYVLREEPRGESILEFSCTPADPGSL